MNQILYILLGLLAGICGGIFGIGGATILIPGLIYLGKLTQHQAQGTAIAALLPPVGLFAFLRYYQAGNVKLTVAALICLGFFLGGLFGANLAHHLSSHLLRKVFGLFLLAISLEMIFGK
jgi:uncharacterized membrane protein YfcA